MQNVQCNQDIIIVCGCFSVYIKLLQCEINLFGWDQVECDVQVLEDVDYVQFDAMFKYVNNGIGQVIFYRCFLQWKRYS